MTDLIGPKPEIHFPKLTTPFETDGEGYVLDSGGNSVFRVNATDTSNLEDEFIAEYIVRLINEDKGPKSVASVYRFYRESFEDIEDSWFRVNTATGEQDMALYEPYAWLRTQAHALGSRADRPEVDISQVPAELR